MKKVIFSRMLDSFERFKGQKSIKSSIAGSKMLVGLLINASAYIPKDHIKNLSCLLCVKRT